MRRESQVRFCEGRGVRFPSATRLVLVFEHEDDARRVLGVLAKQLGKYGLRLHPEKTRMVEFCRPSKSTRGGSQRERSFAMLGFTHCLQSHRRHWPTCDRWRPPDDLRHCCAGSRPIQGLPAHRPTLAIPVAPWFRSAATAAFLADAALLADLTLYPHP